ncbi:MAG: B12-binding domain-containing radical SAM protein, partial [Gammaproteobacteria bacterium]
MKILLIQPPVQDFYDTDIRLQPIGLCYLKAALHKYVPEVEVIIRDYHTGMGRKTVPAPKALRYLKHFYPVADKSPFCSFHQYFHFGLSFAEIAQDIAGLKPDLVGISALFTPYFREALEVADQVKAQLNVPVV